MGEGQRGEVTTRRKIEIRRGKGANVEGDRPTDTEIQKYYNF